MSDTTIERAAFEAWWVDNMNLEVLDLYKFAGGSYACHETNRAWMVWQARAAMQAAEPVGPLVGCGDGNTRIVLYPPVIRKSQSTDAAPDRAPTAEPVAWIVFAEHEGKMTPQYPATLSQEEAERHAKMYGQTPTEVRALGIITAPDRAPSIDNPILAKQVDDWRKEVARLQDLIDTAAGAPSIDSAADAKDAALDALAAQFSQPYMEYFGDAIQDAIRVLKAKG